MKRILKIILLSLIIVSVNVFPKKSSDDSANFTSDSRNLPTEISLDSLLNSAWKLRAVNPAKAIELSFQAIETAKKLNNNSKLAQAYNYLGVVYRNISQYDSSYYAYKKALYYATIADDSTQIAYCYNNIGGYFGYKGEYYLALKNIFRAQQIFEKLRNLRGIAYTKLQAGLAYYKLRNYKESEKYFLSVIELREKINDTLGIAVTKLLLANIYVILKKLNEAEKLLYDALPVFIRYDDVKGIGVTLGSLGELEYYRKNYRNAIQKRRKALPMLKKINYKIGVVENQLGLGLCYMETGRADSARYYLDAASSLALRINYIDGYLKTLRAYYNLYKQTSNTSKMEYYATKLLEVSDSLYGKELILQNNEFRKLTEAQNIEIANMALDENLRQKRTYILYIVIIGIIILLLIAVIFVQNEKLKSHARQIAAAIEDKNKLFGIIAHDLKNPFASLLSYSDFLLAELESGNYSYEDIKLALTQMRSSSHKLFVMIENLLQWARAQTGKIKYLPKTFEVNDVIEETFPYFSQSAKIKNIKIETDIEPGLTCFCDKDMLSTILRNLIGNGVKYTNEGGTIKIKAKAINEKEIEISVEDNGVGVSYEKLKNFFTDSVASEKGTSGEKGTGLGLLLVKEMVEKNKGKISVKSEIGKGTIFKFTLPRKKENS